MQHHLLNPHPSAPQLQVRRSVHSQYRLHDRVSRTKLSNLMHHSGLTTDKIANQLVLVGGRTGASGDSRLPTQTLRTNSEGIATIQLPRAGRWYVKFIRMVPMSDGKVDYESKWATMTMEVRD